MLKIWKVAFSNRPKPQAWVFHIDLPSFRPFRPNPELEGNKGDCKAV